MRKLTKKFAALALGVVTVASLTACGGSSKGITIAVPNRSEERRVGKEC